MTIFTFVQSLWTEKCALQEIVCEMTETAPVFESSFPTTGNKKVSKAKIFRDAITFSKLHYTEDIKIQYPIDAIDFFAHKQFDAEYVQQHINHIRHLIDIENVELERSISDLQKIINGEELHPSEDISPRASRDPLSSSSTKSSSTVNGNKTVHPILDSKVSPFASSLVKSKDQRTYQSSQLHSSQHSNQTLHRSASMPTEVSYFTEVEVHQRNSSNNNQSKSTETSPAAPLPTRSSKLRERLRDAQAELFLADDI